ncbi:hypothetical protein AB205_0213140 [Aquarana catesbeiana]|uniref:Elongation factor G2 n=1 Tax=Aquarana catesbeiana TaxID=8400 RepID=A0A2G9S1P6_AQUCT|nr:hypothetical protein AB205_0213140 [Aquarana catesbeiana]
MWAVLKLLHGKFSGSHSVYRECIWCCKRQLILHGRGRTLSVGNYSMPTGDIKSLRSIISPPTSKIRNIGIMAHIDAGKTTTTERMLYYSGYIRALGDVDDGDTVTDYMAQERERGITIQSAAVTFDWNEHRINLIDTPGNLQGVLLLDSCHAQTLTVWRQADKHSVPRICFLNKMDKSDASFSYSVESIKEKLKANPLLLQLPIGEGKSFQGLVDLLSMQSICWSTRSSEDGGRIFERKPLKDIKDQDLKNSAIEARNALLEQIADLDDEFASLMLEEYSGDFNLIPLEKLQSAVRRITLARSAVPVLCGSSLKNKGVQPLLDAITLYLPSPDDCPHDFISWYKDDLCALAFKVVHDKQRGPLVFVRIYSGMMKSQSAIYNVNKNCTERMSRLLLPFADQQVEISSLSAGNIALTVGLKQTATGDTIVSSKSAAAAASRRAIRAEEKKEKKSEEDLVLAGVEIPEPVFFCTIEPPSVAKQTDLENALKCLQLEDPSLKVRIDPDSGQMILCGMGELHIEIIHDRIRREYGLETYLGPLQIAYRETILSASQASETLDRTINDNRHQVTAEVEVTPLTDGGLVIKYADSLRQSLLNDYKEAIANGIHSAYLTGPLLGSPLLDVGVTVHSINILAGTSATMVSACVSRCIQKALKKADKQILEPLMRVEITMGEEYLGSVLGDLAKRRGNVQEIQSRFDNKVILAFVPLAELMGYSTDLRTLTSGSATFTLELANYEGMDPQDQNTLLKKKGLL